MPKMLRGELSRLLLLRIKGPAALDWQSNLWLYRIRGKGSTSKLKRCK